VNRFKVNTQDFSRKRKLEFKNLLFSLMSFGKSSVQVELDRFYKTLFQSSNNFDSISRSAFTQSRKKLLPEAFIELADEQLNYFSANALKNKTWKGYRLVAIDGSTLNLPDSSEIQQHFGFTHNQHDQINKARCSFAYDVLNELILDAQITTYKSCEKELAVLHLQKLNSETDILIFDRGYPALWLMALLEKMKFKFCFRLSSSWKDAADLTNSNETDIDWVSVRRSKKDCSKFATYELPQKLSGLRLLKIPLSSGQTEILATNLLDRQVFDILAIKSIYNMRWGVEEAYKLFKKAIHIEHFTGKTVHSIEQDFYAKVFMLNIASILRTQFIDQHSVSKSKSKHIQKVNKTHVLAKIKDYLISLMTSENIICIINQIKQILKNSFDIIRPNRSFVRTDTSARRRSKSMNYKGI
jgi:hypothetical protein